MSIFAQSLVVLGMIATPLAAQSRGDTQTVIGERAPTVEVSYADLNIARPEGLRKLKFRLSGAVDTVCEDHTMTFDVEDCRWFAWKGVRPQLAHAIQRAHEIAMTGHSSIAAAALVIVAR